MFKQTVKEEESDPEEETTTEQEELDNHHDDEDMTTKVAPEDISGQSVWNYVRTDEVFCAPPV